MTRLIDTNEARAWIAQFGLRDQAAAANLVSEIRLVSHREFAEAVVAEIRVIEKQAPRKLALFPIVEVPKTKFGTPLHGQPPLAIYFELAKGSVKPADPDSSGVVGQILKNLSREAPKRFALTPSLDAMRAEKMSDIVFVDDLLGSGRRFGGYWKYVVPRTIKSWLSSKHCKMWVVVFAAQKLGMKLIHRKIPKLPEDRVCAAIRLTKRFVDIDPTNLSGRYAERTSRPALDRGYQKTLCPIAFQHGCPNNAPAILWASNGASWTGLFPNRAIPVALNDCFVGKNDRQPDALWEANQGYLALAMLDEGWPNEWTKDDWLVISCLGLLARKVSIKDLPEILMYEQHKIDLAIASAQKHLLIDSAGVVTPIGHQVLDAVRARGRGNRTMTVPPKVEQEPGTYYPTQFEGVARKLAKSGH